MLTLVGGARGVDMGDGPVLLCGLGKVGWRVFDTLRAAGLPVTVVDTRVDLDDPRLSGSAAIRGDVRDSRVLQAAGIGSARGVVIVTSDDLVNVSTALLARRLNPTARVVVRMFNQSLVSRLGGAVKNTAALSVSALTAPLLVLTALTGEALTAFKVGEENMQVAEVGCPSDGPVREFAAAHRVAVVAAGGQFRPPPSTRLSVGDRVVVCGRPGDLAPLLHPEGDAVRWAGRVRRWVRTVRRSVGLIDWPVRAGGLVLFFVLFASTLTFRYGLNTTWADGFYQTVSVIATGADLHGDRRQGLEKVFLAGLKLVGAALLAGVTALLTQYLIRAKLGGALEAGRIPDGGHVVVCGLGNVGFRCVEELVRLGRPVVAVEKVADNPFAATVRRMGVPVVVGDASVPEVLRQVRAESARAVIAATSSELANLEIGLLVREVHPNQRVVVRLADADFAAAVREAADIRHALSVPALAAPAFVAALLGDRVSGLLTVAGKTLAVADVSVEADDAHLCGRPLAAVADEFNVVPVGLRNGKPLAPAVGPEVVLATGDRLTVLAELGALQRLLGVGSARGVHLPDLSPHPEPAMSETIESIKNAAKSAADKAKDLAQQGADAASSLAHKAGDALDSLGNKTKNAAEDASDATKDAVRDAGKAVERAGQDIKAEGK
jgi:Trk K+ transport system NAD-binding subunit